MTWGDTLDLEILGRIAGKFKHFRSQIFEDSRDVDSSWKGRVSTAKHQNSGTEVLTLCANAHLVLRVILEETLDSTARELD